MHSVHDVDFNGGKNCELPHTRRLRRSRPGDPFRSRSTVAAQRRSCVNRPICEICGVHPVTSRGGGQWHKQCKSCRSKPWVRYKGDICEICGFVPVHRVQLDVDHIDGNKDNESPSNRQTICANCHRLKTYLNSDWEQKEKMELESFQMDLDFDNDIGGSE